MSMRNERPVDALIDEAARRLVAGEPSSSLRSSVRERLRGRRSVWSFVPAFAGVAALLVVAVIVGRALSGAPSERDSTRPADQPVANSNVPAVASQRNDAAPIQPVLSTPRQLARRPAADVAAPPAEEEPPIPPIAIEPLSTAPLGAVQIAVDVSSGVMPIEIEPLQIEPLLGQ